MVAKTIQRTPTGLPVLKIQTFQEYQEEFNRIGKEGIEKLEKWVNQLIEDIKSKDPCYERFIRDTADFYPNKDQHNKVALERLTAGYILLDREGLVPKIDPDEYEIAFKALSPRSLAIMNMGTHLDPIGLENPEFLRFIMFSSQYMPTDSKYSLKDITNPSLRSSLMSDLSNGYTILAYCQNNKHPTSS